MEIKITIHHVIGTGQEKGQWEWAGPGIMITLHQVFIHKYAVYMNKCYIFLFCTYWVTLREQSPCAYFKQNVCVVLHIALKLVLAGFLAVCYGLSDFMTRFRS